MQPLNVSKMPIRRLPKQLANQIAAGEVIERPASVVKELLENSLDAGASRIDIDIAQGGLQHIIVRDNGTGIPRGELALAVARHATSKIQTLPDLESILSMGFRGEALASIASVTRMQITSCTADAEQAWCLNTTLENTGEKAALTPAAHPLGTTVAVHDLFYNTPARRKFLRVERTEFRHVDDVVRRVALSHFELGFTLRHNQREVYRLQPGVSESEQQRRLLALCGKPFTTNALQLDFAASGLRLWGWASAPGYSRSQSDLQYFYVNRRIVRDRLIAHALRQAYQETLHPGRHPAYVLHLELDPKQVDVNVHPTKHEVRFREGRLVHDFIYRVLKDTLATVPQEKTIDNVDFNHNITGSHSGYVKPLQTRPAAQSHVAELARDYAALATKSETQSDQAVSVLGHALAQLHQRYILAEAAMGLVLVDILAARRHIIHARLNLAWQTSDIKSQPLLVPQSLQVSHEEIQALETHAQVIEKMGFDLGCTGPESVLLRHIPTLLRDADIPTLVHGLLNTLSHYQLDQPASDMAKFFSSLMQYGVTQLDRPYSQAQMNALLQDLVSVAALEDESGQSIWTLITMDALQRLIAKGH